MLHPYRIESLQNEVWTRYIQNTEYCWPFGRDCLWNQIS